MTNQFEPELGQMGWGNPWSELKCPEYIIACLREISNHIEILWHNQGIHSNGPTENSGSEYINDVFEMRAYVWDEDNPKSRLPNFKYGDFEVSWYKYIGRGTSMNREIDPHEFVQIFDHCLKSIIGEDNV